MPTIEKIAFILYDGLYDYVPRSKQKNYHTEFCKQRRFNSKFVLEFFPKYINFERWAKKPKHEYDALLFNYWLTEVCTYGLNGLKGSTMINEYNLGRNRIINKRLKQKAKIKRAKEKAKSKLKK